MKPTTHNVIGLLSALIICEYFNLPKLEIVSGAMNTAALPDIDLKINLFPHRGITHSLLIPCLLYISYYLMDGSPKYIILGAIIGLLSHILSDMLNGKGTEIFWPSRKNFRVMDIQYNGFIENLLFKIMTGIIVVLLIGVKNIVFLLEFIK